MPPTRLILPVIAWSIVAVAPAQAEVRDHPSCDAQQGFGVPFGPMSQDLRRSAIRIAAPETPAFPSPYVAYRLRPVRDDARYVTLEVTTGRTTGEIFEVTAYGPAFDPGEESRYDDTIVPRLRPLAEAYAHESGMPLSTEGRPPYRSANDAIEIRIGHDYRNETLRFAFTCVSVPAQMRYERQALREVFRQTGTPPDAPSAPATTRP